MTAFDKVCLGVVSTFILLPCDKSQSILVDETLGKGIHDGWVSFGGSVFRQLRGVQGKLLPELTVFQVSLAQNNQYIKVTFWGEVACYKLSLWSSMALQINHRNASRELWEACCFMSQHRKNSARFKVIDCHCLVAKYCPILLQPHGLRSTRLPFPSPRDLSNPGIKPASPVLKGRFFTTEPPGKTKVIDKKVIYENWMLIRLTSRCARECCALKT